MLVSSPFLMRRRFAAFAGFRRTTFAPFFFAFFAERVGVLFRPAARLAIVGFLPMVRVFSLSEQARNSHRTNSPEVMGDAQAHAAILRARSESRRLAS